MAPTIKEIAKLANVSIATVSRAVSNDPKVKPATKELIMKIVKELNYNPNILARNFVKKQSNIVCLILPDLGDEFFSEVIKGVDEEAFLNGFYTMITSSHKNRNIVDSLSTFIGGGLVGGIILLVPSLDIELKEILYTKNIPVVIISGDDNLNDFDSVSIDNYNGAKLMTNFLIKEKKYKKFAFIAGPPDNNDALQREKGFLDACKNLNVKISRGNIYNGNFTRESGQVCCKKLLENKDKPEVIFAANDMMAIGCYDVLIKNGIKVPKEMGLVGFDDIEMSKFMGPGLTTMHVDIYELGKTAAQILIEKINSKGYDKRTKVKINTKLSVRKSV